MLDGKDLKRGDICRHGTNAFPRYRVIHVDGDKVWLRDVDTGADAVVDVANCRLVTHEDLQPVAPQHEPDEPDSLRNPPPGPGAPS
jgi:hypothetical protein